MKKNTKTKAVSEHRQGAEKQISLAGNDPKAPPALISPESMANLVHELQVHQVELEMQNEELLRIQEELESSRSRYLRLYDLAPVGYFTLNEKGVILAWPGALWSINP
jgi:PAS domain-containing protein